jgi:hypothetical protein
MNYLIVQSFFDNIFSLVLEHRITLGIFWFFLFGYFLWRLSKKDIIEVYNSTVTERTI